MYDILTFHNDARAYSRVHIARAFSRVHIALQEDRRVAYTVDTTAYSFWLPAAAATPNFLFCSCNGMTGADCGAVSFARKSSSVSLPVQSFCFRWCIRVPAD
jgi:hypothetical protein